MNVIKFFSISLMLITFSFASRAFAQDPNKGAVLFKQSVAYHEPKGDGNPVMIPFLGKLNEQDMKDLAAYISKL